MSVKHLPPSQKRKELEALVDKNDPLLARTLELQVIEERDIALDEVEGKHCHWYTFLEFPRNWNDYIVEKEISERPPGLREAGDLEEATVVLYFNSSRKNNGIFPSLAQGKLVHSGRMQNGLVTSKFTFGSVYRHKIEDVPECYGDQAVLLRSLPESVQKEEMERVLGIKWYEGGI